MAEHQVKWTAPSPLWAEAANNTDPVMRQTFNQPAILRFATDSFMDDLLALLEKDPVQVSGLVAQWETWREPIPPPQSASLLEPTAPMSSFARKLNRLRLIAEHGRGRAALPSPASAKTPDNTEQRPLKLYQPGHQRYYLVSACLVCGLPGMPDRALDTNRQERVTFVVRRLIHPDKGNAMKTCDPNICDEYAFVITPRGSGWQQITNTTVREANKLVPGEEQLPLFAVNFSEDDERKRRLFAGLVPVGRREAYVSATPLNGKAETAQKTLPKTARKILFRSQVAEPWKNVIRQAYVTHRLLQEPSLLPPNERPTDAETEVQRDALLKAAREQIQTLSWYILLDFAKYLGQYLTRIWAAITDPQRESDLSTAAERKLLDALDNTTIPAPLISALTIKTKNEQGGEVDPLYDAADFSASLRQALKEIVKWEGKLETVTGSYDRQKSAAPDRPNEPHPDWPSFLFPLADPDITGPQIPNAIAPLNENDEVDEEVPLEERDGADQKAAIANVDKLVALVVRALPTAVTKPEPPLPLAAQKVMDTRDSWFVIRCVFERPNCGPLEQLVVSEPTKPFQLAGFFDPDAPARPIRIALPIDTSPAGLRKFDKNTAFMISDMLCGQIDRMKGLTLGDLVRSVLPWPFHKDLSVPDNGPCKDQNDPNLSLGMMCSLSIPIITICALILLIIIVSLLDIIFRWIPYFIMCFPLPGFKAKR